jgi:hypothetical protein
MRCFFMFFVNYFYLTDYCMAFPLQHGRLQKAMLCSCLFECSEYDAVIGLYLYVMVNSWIHNTKKNYVPETQFHLLPFVRCEVMKQPNDILLLFSDHKKLEYCISSKGNGI